MLSEMTSQPEDQEQSAAVANPQFARAIYIDLEYTCWEEMPPPGMKQEIIEIGLAEMDLAILKIVKEAVHLVRPKRWDISAYCSRITGLTSDDIRGAQPLASVLARIEQDFAPRGKLFVAWGDDLRELLPVCPSDLLQGRLKRGVDLSTAFRQISGMTRQLGVRDALLSIGETFEGEPHQALVDARNTARLHAAIIRKLLAPIVHPEPEEHKQKVSRSRSDFGEKLHASLADPNG